MLTQRGLMRARDIVFGAGLPFNPFNFLYCLIAGMAFSYYLAFVSSSFVHTILELGFLGTLVVQIVLIFISGVAVSILASVIRPVFFLLRRWCLQFWHSLPNEKEKTKGEYIRLADGEWAEIVGDDRALPEKPKRYVE